MDATGDSLQQRDPLAGDKGEGGAWPGGDTTLARPPRLVLGRWLWRSPAGRWLRQGMRPGADETEAIAFFDGLLWGGIAGNALKIALGVVLRVIGAL